MTKPAQWICDSQRDNRLARKARARGIVIAKWRGSVGAMFARMGIFISLDSAAELRRAGRFQLARYALARADDDHRKWINCGGYLP